jgi:hypothetical protein
VIEQMLDRLRACARRLNPWWQERRFEETLRGYTALAREARSLQADLAFSIQQRREAQAALASIEKLHRDSAREWKTEREFLEASLEDMRFKVEGVRVREGIDRPHEFGVQFRFSIEDLVSHTGGVEARVRPALESALRQLQAKVAEFQNRGGSK